MTREDRLAMHETVYKVVGLILKQHGLEKAPEILARCLGLVEIIEKVQKYWPAPEPLVLSESQEEQTE